MTHTTDDPFTRASPTYVEAIRTNQSNGRGWDFRDVEREAIGIIRHIPALAVCALVLGVIWFALEVM